MKYEIKVFSELDTELKEYWQRLETNSNNYCFQSYDWFENWVENFRKSNENYLLQIITISLNSNILGILPFEIEKKFNLNILKWAGSKHTDYMAPVLSENFDLKKDDFDLVWKAIIKLIANIDFIYLNKQPKHINKIENPFVKYLKNYKDSNTQNISLPKTWKEYTGVVLKKNFHIQNLRKKKLLKKLGNLKFKIINDKNFKEKCIEELIKQKNERLTSQGVKKIFKLEDLNFYKNFEKKIFKKIKIFKSDRNKIPMFLSSFDLMISFIKNTFSRKAMSPTKMFEAFAMGIPFLCNKGIGDVDLILNKHKVGITIDIKKKIFSKKHLELFNNCKKIKSNLIIKKTKPFYDISFARERYNYIYNFLENDQEQ